MISTEYAMSTTEGLTPKRQFLDVFEREHATTLRVLEAYPADKLDLKAHERGNSAGEIAWIFVLGQQMLATALTTGFDWSTPPSGPPPPPDSLQEIIEAVEDTYARVVELVRGMPDEQLAETVQFFVAPRTLGDVPKLDFLWGILFDQIHHRGQLSIYLRMVGAKVPSIYGPTADEPWM